MAAEQLVTVTIRLTGMPSRSKQAGPCWVALLDPDSGQRVYATTGGVSIEVPAGTLVQVAAKATLRRATRTAVQRDAWTVVATDDPDAREEVSVGSPQSVDATITGARALVV